MYKWLMNLLVVGWVEATKFVTTGGTAAQFVKGDGSLDATVYSTQTNIDSSIDDIEIGGRNLLLNSKGTVIDRLSSLPGSRREYSTINVKYAPIDYSSMIEVIISFDLEMIIGDASNPAILIYDSNHKGPIGLGSTKSVYIKSFFGSVSVGDIVKGRVYVEHSLGERIDSDKPSSQIHFYSTYLTDNFFNISNIKIEKGNKATDWSPAPEDQVTDWDETNVDSFAYLKNKPTSFPPSAHAHTIPEITNLQSELNKFALRTVSITGTGGLTGGGNLTANRTLDLSTTTKSDIAKGVTAHGWTNHAGKYLPLSGGTLTNSTFGEMLTIHRNAANNSSIKFTATSGTAWHVGMDVVSGEFGIVDSAVGFNTSKVKLNGLTGVVTATGGTSTQWNQAFGWGDHSGKYSLLSHKHTTADVTSLTGYALGANSSLGVSDSLNTALGKLQGQINSKSDKTTTITAGTGLTGGGSLAANRTLAVSYGSAAGTSVEGNDSRVVSAFNKMINALTVTGDVNKTVTLTRQDGTTLVANFSDNNTESPDDVINTMSFNTETGVITAVTSLGEQITASIDGRFSLLGHTHALGDIAGLVAALAGKEPSFTKGTAFNKNFGTSAGTVMEGNDSRAINGQTAFGWDNHATQGYLKAADISNKVDKITGKGLSENDYTTAEKNKVAANTLKVSNATHTGDVTGATALTIANSAVTHAKYQNIATQRILGRGTTGTGNVQELTLGSNLTLSTTGELSATNTNTTYSAGTGLSLSGTTFGQAITTSGTGTFVTGVAQTTNGFQINLGTPPNTNTTYSTGSLAEVNTGTVSTGRVWGANVLNQWINAKGFITSYVGGYSYPNGFLIKTDIARTDNCMLVLHIKGNSYGGGVPINTFVQVYNYVTSDAIISTGALNTGYKLNEVKVFYYNNLVYFWVPQQSGSQTMTFQLLRAQERVNRVDTVTNAAVPASGVEKMVTITPRTAWFENTLTSLSQLTDNIGVASHIANNTNPHSVTKAQVGLGNVDNTADSAKNVLSATRLSTARTINGVSFNGTANITVADSTKEPKFTKNTAFNKNFGAGATDIARGNHTHTLGGVTGLVTALAGKEPSFTKNTGFNKAFGTTAGTVAQGNDSRINYGQTAYVWGNHATAGYATSIHTHTWAQITGKPTTFEPSAHTHAFASLTSKPTTVGGYGITDFNALGDARWLLSSSYTAADVLTKLKTVDGSGSGLDADLLRGVHWGNVNTPIVTTNKIEVNTTGVNTPVIVNKSEDVTLNRDATYGMAVSQGGTVNKLVFGYSDLYGAGIIDAVKSFESWKNLLLTPNGGNVGIGGITNPTEKLEVNGKVKATSLKLGNWEIIPNGTSLEFRLSGVAKGRLTSAGVVEATNHKNGLT